MLRTLSIGSLCLCWLVSGGSLPARGQGGPVRVVTTLPVYASLTKEIGGSEVQVSAIAEPAEDAHFVRPKPSFALDLRRADAFVTTGLDLELWVPTLLDRAGNPAVLEGGRGYITAYTGIRLLDIPAAADRSAGDVHIFGNPHLTTDPLRALQVARNITTGLKRVAPARASNFDQGLERFADRIHRRLFGERLVELLGGPTLEQMALNGTLFAFLESNELGGAPLIGELGGWLEQAEPFRGRQMICYHKDWAYFEERFQVRCADYVESKPGIPPTPGHVSALVTRMREERIRVLLAPRYYPENQVEAIANRGDAAIAYVPFAPGAVPGVDDYFSLVDNWIQTLSRAFASG
ncbi:MAG TPA: metal ABC transporter substrate-binding protein [Longimicrobiales bacterium]|nr:metal ABC transporter substrate-binding protein [Longimicrobiales bacterium]